VALQDLLKGWASRGFADFPGLAIDGSVPVKQDVANQLIAELLASAASNPRPGPSGDLVAALLPLLKKVEITATEGVVTVQFQVRA
jgi:hypothetical protein